MERGSVWFENITDAANCVDQFFLVGIIDFRAQAANDDIDNIGLGVEIDSPDVLGDFFSGDDLARRAR